MVFSFNNETKITLATFRNGDITEHYECSFRSCDNPVCNCGTVYLSLFPLKHEDKDNLIVPYRVDIDIIDRKLIHTDEVKIPEENLKFANLLISKLDDADFHFLWEFYYTYKNKKTAEATIDSIDAHFDFREIEENSLMVEYNDVLPFGDHLLVTINDENLIIFDQYCVLPECSCTETGLAICSAGESDKVGDELFFVTLDYRKKKWGMLEGRTKSVDTKTARSAAEEQIPDIYKKFLNRHTQLKDIYSHCKKKHFEDIQQLDPPGVGRNDPCPCGSGKKYKSCCLRKSN